MPDVAGEQPRQPIRSQTLAPTSEVTVIAVQRGANVGPRQAIGQSQNQTSVTSGVGSTVAGARVALKFRAFVPGPCHHVLHRRHDATILNVTGH